MSLDYGTLVSEVTGSLPSAELKEILFMCLFAGIPICLVDDNLGSEDPFSFSVTSHAVSPLWGSRHRWALSLWPHSHYSSCEVLSAYLQGLIESSFSVAKFGKLVGMKCLGKWALLFGQSKFQEVESTE